MKEESETEYIDQLKREIRCLMRANTNAETGTKIWRKLYSDIELESKVKMLREAVTYEKQLEAFRLRNCELSALVEEKRMECVGLEEKLIGLSSMKDVIDNELKGVRAECGELKKRVAQLEDGHRLMQKWELDEEKRRECVGLLEQLNDLSSRKDVAERKNGELELEKNRLEKELNDCMAVCNDLKDQNAHLQALMCEREKVALNKINDLCQEIQNLKRENGDLKRTDIADLGFSENDVSDNDEENNSRNEREEIQTESQNESEETMSESRSRSEEIMNKTREENEESMSERSSGSEGDQHEASAELDDEALPTAGIISESRNRSEGIISETRKESEESLSERSSENEGIQRQASVDLEGEALPAVGGDYSIPIDIESDSVVEISDSEDSLGSDDDSHLIIDLKGLY
ncbi:daple-like protein [Papaver somniferum]|uniref:daple-like protein n=1 Tax=Papaver somniferum TaxID=3469 RepID=UPI000E6F4A96|nr:daple-like protein [Papaver somniferum]